VLLFKRYYESYFYPPNIEVYQRSIKVYNTLLDELVLNHQLKWDFYQFYKVYQKVLNFLGFFHARMQCTHRCSTNLWSLILGYYRSPTCAALREATRERRAAAKLGVDAPRRGEELSWLFSFLGNYDDGSTLGVTLYSGEGDTSLTYL
jgi:hypothetical protein